MSTKTNTLLAAARLAYPAIEWQLSSVNNQPYYVPIALPVYFDLTNPADAYALWKALELSEYTISYNKNSRRWFFSCYRDGIQVTPCRGFKTDIDAMLAAVETLEAMK